MGRSYHSWQWRASRAVPTWADIDGSCRPLALPTTLTVVDITVISCNATSSSCWCNPNLMICVFTGLRHGTNSHANINQADTEPYYSSCHITGLSYVNGAVVVVLVQLLFARRFKLNRVQVTKVWALSAVGFSTTQIWSMTVDSHITPAAYTQ